MRLSSNEKNKIERHLDGILGMIPRDMRPEALKYLATLCVEACWDHAYDTGCEDTKRYISDGAWVND